MSKLLLWMIGVYRTRVSPHKGFYCAYRAQAGRRSCSAFGFLAIQRYGAIVGLMLLRRRFRKCSNAYRSGAERLQRIRSGPARQRGHCDLPIGDCDFGHGCHASDIVDCGGCDDFGCIDKLWKKRPWRRKPAGS
jgi:putative component of membrane protein insertase Oxa1/YidC/SpoIIIJ protein YidD